MKKVFYICSNKYPEFKADQKMILGLIRKLGYEPAPIAVVSFLDGTKYITSPKEISDIENRELNQSDCLIAEVTGRSFTIGYHYARALAQKRPCLFLIKEEYKGKDVLSSMIRGAENEPVEFEYYNRKNIEPILKRFLSNPSRKAFQKFNFIISPYIADYLDWIAHVKRKSKSDYLRNKIITEIIEEDKDYQSYLKEQYEEAWYHKSK